MNYSDDLRDARWQKRRLEIMHRDNFLCRLCPVPSEGDFLNVHHKVYHPGRRAWEYEDDELITLCEDCHERLHHVAPAKAPEGIRCTWCKKLLIPATVAGRLGKNKPLCELCAMGAEEQRSLP